MKRKICCLLAVSLFVMSVMGVTVVQANDYWSDDFNSYSDYNDMVDTGQWPSSTGTYVRGVQDVNRCLVNENGNNCLKLSAFGEINPGQEKVFKNSDNQITTFTGVVTGGFRMKYVAPALSGVRRVRFMNTTDGKTKQIVSLILKDATMMIDMNEMGNATQYFNTTNLPLVSGDWYTVSFVLDPFDTSQGALADNTVTPGYEMTFTVTIKNETTGASDTRKVVSWPYVSGNGQNKNFTSSDRGKAISAITNYNYRGISRIAFDYKDVVGTATEPASWYIDDLKFSDSTKDIEFTTQYLDNQDNPITGALAANQQINVKSVGTIQQGTSAGYLPNPNKAKSMVALYDNGILKQVYAADMTPATDTDTSVTINNIFTIPADVTSPSIKTFIWDDDTSIKPWIAQDEYLIAN